MVEGSRRGVERFGGRCGCLRKRGRDVAGGRERKGWWQLQGRKGGLGSYRGLRRVCQARLLEAEKRKRG